MLVAADPVIGGYRELVSSLALRVGLPAIGPTTEFVATGGLATYTTSISDAYHKAGVYAGRILRGASPGDLPVEQPTKFELVVNLRTARALGLSIPPTVLARTDEVIE